MSIYAEVFARVHKTPVTIYLVAGLISLVPGSGIYRTMEYCVMGENQLFWETGLYTLEIASVIGFAMIVYPLSYGSFLPDIPFPSGNKPVWRKNEASCTE